MAQPRRALARLARGVRLAVARSRATVLPAAAVVAGTVLSGVLVVGSTNAAFTATTSSPANAWAAGAVTLGDDDGGAALLSATGLLPGSTGSACITVTYTGDVPTTVRLFTTSVTGALAPDVTLAVEQGTGGGFGTCTGFSGSGVYSGPMSGFPSTFATGLGTFAPSAAGAARVYRFTWTLDAAAPSARQGQAATAAFRWESRS